MFKKFAALCLVVVLTIPTLLSCNGSKELSPEIELQMRENYFLFLCEIISSEELHLEDIGVQHYFGKFNGCEVVYMRDKIPHTQAERSVQIAGYTIVFPSGQEVYAYKDSKFYTIKEAYDAKYLTKGDVYKIGKQVSATP